MGKGEELWNDNPHKKCHKDIDTRWTVKRRKTEYGYTEHVFGFMEQSMRGLMVRTVGLARAKANVAMTSLVYDVFRFCQILRYHGDWLVATY